MKTECFVCMIVVASCLAVVSPASGVLLNVETESGALWFSRNDTRIPGDSGVRFNLMDLTGSGPDVYVRLHASCDFTPRHSVRLTIAPLEVDGTGILDRDVLFAGTTFSGGERTRGRYRFDTYRLTYRWMFHHGRNPKWGLGCALLVRDAKIELQQGPLKASSDDLGLVPLLHLYGAWLLNERVSLMFDVEGAGAPPGRAVDAVLKLVYAWPNGWHVSAGYRTLEGGADNDSVYTFGWLHFASFGIGYRF